LFEYFIIPETQNFQAMTFEGCCPLPISAGIVQMLPPVQLDDQSRFGAVEIDNVGADGMLAAGFPTRQASCSQMMPEPVFGVSGVLA